MSPRNLLAVELCLLLFPVGSVVGVEEVEIGKRYRHVLTEVVLVVAEVLLQRLPVPAMVLPDIGFSVAVGLVLWRLRD